MKTIILGVFALLLSFGLQGQNQNKKIETKTTTTTVKDSKGAHQVVRKEEVKEIQNLELEKVPDGTKNTNIKPTPVQVTETTKISIDGEEKIVDADHSASYLFNNEKYQLLADKAGYKVMGPNSISFLRRTYSNNYIYKNEDKFSLGHFDAKGNLILESYDDKTDTIKVEVLFNQKK